MLLKVWEDKDGRKRMSKNNAKALTTLRQKLRKYIKVFEEEMKQFRENPDDADSDAEAEDVPDPEVGSDDEGDVPLDAAAFKKEPSVLRY